MLIFLIFSIITIIFFYAHEKSKINIAITFSITISIFYLMMFPKSSMDSISSGVNLFVNAIFPTLFPFLILTNMLMNYNGINIFGKLFGNIISKPLGISKNSIFPLIVSFICGYPLGTKYLNDVHKKNLITDFEFQRMMNIASNTSPLFLIGSVGSSMLGNKNYGYILLIANYFSCVLMCFIIPNKNKFKISLSENKVSNKKNFGDVLKSSLENAIKTCAIVGSFIIFFSLVKEIFTNNIYTKILFDKIPILKSIFIGLFEITNGVNLIISSNISISITLSIISFLCSFSGACIILQCYSFVHDNKAFNLKKYIFYKLVQGIISFLITFIACSIFI